MNKNMTNLQNISFNYFNFTAILLLTVSLIFTVACGDDVEDRVDRVGGVTAAQILENPTAYAGKIVTVSGEVDDIIEPRAFEMDSGLTTGELLVLGRAPYPALPEAGNRAYVVGDVATVTGLVTMLVTADIEREIGWDLSPQIEAEYNARPVIIAQNVLFKVGPRSGTTGIQPVNTANVNVANVNTANANMTNTAANNANMTGGDITDLALVVNAPDRTNLIGKRLNITKVQVQSVIGDRVFIVGPDATKGLPVVISQEATPNTPTEGLFDINPGQTISLKGEIMRMPSQAVADKEFNGLISQKELSSLANHQIYLRSDSNSINILQRP